MDNATLTLSGGFKADTTNVDSTANLNIYSQSFGDNMGKLVATNSGFGFAMYLYGALNIYGGNISAKADKNSAVLARKGCDIYNGIVCNDGVSGKNVVRIEEDGKVTAIGGKCAIKEKLFNKIPGTGWTNTDGTEGKTEIEVRTYGKDIDAKYKKYRRRDPSMAALFVPEVPVVPAFWISVFWVLRD